MKIFKKNFFILTIISLTTAGTSFAQDDFDKFLEAGLADANTLLEGYVSPFMKGFGTSLGSGWYNTAKAHKSFGFDLTVTVNAAYVPDKDLFYTPNLNNGVYSSTSPVDKSPTIFGPDGSDNTPVYTYSYQENGETYTGEFEGPEGLNVKDEIGIQAVPVPMAQLGIGIIKNTDIKIRWTPEIDIDEDGKFKLIGFGIMHDIKQYIPGIKNLPFDLSAFVGYTSISTEIALDDEDASSGDGDISTQDGKGIFDVNTLTIQGLISKKFSVLTLYGGIGFNRVRSEIKLEGTYTASYADSADKVYVDPIDLSFKAGGPRMTAGFRLKLAILTLHADYTLQEYDVLSAGIGFSVR